jgi:hypothetical protein
MKGLGDESMRGIEVVSLSQILPAKHSATAVVGFLKLYTKYSFLEAQLSLLVAPKIPTTSER